MTGYRLSSVRCNILIIADGKGKAIGQSMAHLLEQYLRTTSLLLFTKWTLLSIEEFDKLIADAIAEAKDVNLRAYLPL